MRVFVVLVLLVGLGVGAWLVLRRAPDPDAPPPPPDHVATAADTFALLVGCTEYPLLKVEMEADIYEASVRLKGPLHDVTLMHAVLRGYLGVPEANIRRLAGWPDDAAQRPTRANVLEHLDRLAREVPRGGRVLFLFAGHGSQQPDKGNEEADGQDEILMPADAGKWDPATGGAVNAITDDEIRARMLALRDAGATVWAVFDCCHSGTMMRGSQTDLAGADTQASEVRLRELSPALLGIPAPTQAPGSRGEASPVGAVFEESGVSLKGIAAFYGAHSSEQAPEMVLPLERSAPDRQVHGLLTFQVARALQRHGGGLTLAELFQHVRAGYESTRWEGASPITEGDLGLRVRPGAGGAVLLLRREADGLVADGGSLRGLTVGSVLEVFRPGGFGEPTSLLGKLTLTEVEPLRSLCGAHAGGPAPGSIPDGAPARVVDVAPGGRALRLAGLVPADLDRVRGRMAADRALRARFQCVPPEQADWSLGTLPAAADGRSRYRLDPLGPDAGFEPLEAGEEELLSVLERLRRADSLRRMAASGPLAKLPEGLELTPLLQRLGTGEREPLPAGCPVRPGDRIWLRIANGTGHDVDVAVKGLDTLQVESHVWPQDEPSRHLASDEKEPSLVPLRVNDDGVGRESLIVIVAVRARGAARLDVGDLSGAALEGPPEQIAQRQGEHELLGTLAIPAGTARGGDATESVAVHEITWTTTWGRMGIPSALLKDEMIALEPPVESAPETAGGTPPPDRQVAWHFARILRGDEARGDVLLLTGRVPASGDGAIGVLVDADGDAGLASLTAAEAARRAVSGGLPVEALLVLLPTRSWAAYPRTPGDLTLGRVLAAPTGSDRADRRYELGASGWTSEPACGPWLSSSLAPLTGDRRVARKRFVNALRGVFVAR